MGRFPKTKAEAEDGHNLYGFLRHEYESTKCAYPVSKSWSEGWQCRRKPGYGYDGLYCRKHAEIMERGTTPKKGQS